MDIIHPNVPETIKRLADAYEYLVERGGASSPSEDYLNGARGSAPMDRDN